MELKDIAATAGNIKARVSSVLYKKVWFLLLGMRIKEEIKRERRWNQDTASFKPPAYVQF